MPNLNRFTGCGHLARQPELKKTKSGISVTNFTVGISYNKKVGDNWEKQVEWVRGVVFGKPAEWLAEASKGDLCVFEGRLQTRSWEDNTGQKKYSTEVICDMAQAVKKNAQGMGTQKQESFDDGTMGNEDCSNIPF